jgi:hypothetical protein
VHLDNDGAVTVLDALRCDEPQSVRSLGALAQSLCTSLPKASLALALRLSNGEVTKLADARIAIEAQLVPLNRGAARRVLARLVRDALKDDGAKAEAETPAARSDEQLVGAEGIQRNSFEQLGEKLSASIDPLSTVAAPLAKTGGSATESAIDTAPDAPVLGAVESAPDHTPLPSRLPPPPRLGSLTSMQIGISATSSSDADDQADEQESDTRDAGSEMADQTVSDVEPPAAAKKKKSPGSQGPMLAASLLLFVFAGLFFAWRLMHR